MIKKILRFLNFNSEVPIPCSETEIAIIEDFAGFMFPSVYRSFLINMGRYGGSFMRGSMCFYDDLILINEEARLLLNEHGFRVMPDQAFVFWMHQGYQFAFFVFNEGEDPPVYYYNETLKQNDFEQTYNTLSEFYASELELSVKAGFLKPPPGADI